MAGEFSSSETQSEHTGMRSVLELEHPTHPEYDYREVEVDEDEDTHVIRSNNRASLDDSFPEIMAEAYPGIKTVPAVRAEAALDVRRAGDLLQVVEAVKDPSKQAAVKKVAVGFLDKLHHVDTGAIDLPNASPEAKLGMVASALLETAREMAEPVNAKELLDENAALKAQNDQLLSMIMPDQLQMMRTLQEQADRIAHLEAQLAQKDRTISIEREKIADRDQVIYGNSLETFRGQMTRMRSIGSAVVHLARPA